MQRLHAEPRILLSRRLNCAPDPLGTFCNVDVSVARLLSDNVVVLSGPIGAVCNSSLTVEPEGWVTLLKVLQDGVQ